MSDVKRPEISIWEVDQAIAAALPEAFNKVIAERDRLRSECDRKDAEIVRLKSRLEGYEKLLNEIEFKPPYLGWCRLRDALINK